jgi:hypothetical protein
MDPTPRIGIVGDVHQDLDALVATLDGPLANCAQLVCTGDVVDRGPAGANDVLDVLEARGVTITLGNHELAYLGGPSFPGMREPRNRELPTRLRRMLSDGQLVAAVAHEGTLIVHGGVSRAFWNAELRAACGSDVDAIATHLSRRLLRAAMRQDFRNDPMFASGAGRRTPGPFWAHAERDLLGAGSLPPFRQVVGHVALSDTDWMELGAGSLRAVLWSAPPPGALGHALLS